MITPRHPVIKGMTYGFLGIGLAALRIWTPSEAAITCSVAFAVDGLLFSLLSRLNGLGSQRGRIFGFLVPLGSLFIAKGLASYLLGR